MSAKKFKAIPAQTPAPTNKEGKEEKLWVALKRHILKERERKKQGELNSLSLPLLYCKIPS